MVGLIFDKLSNDEKIGEVVQRVFKNLDSAQKQGKLTEEVKQSIQKDIDAMTSYQIKMGECWNSLRSPLEVKSIFGLIPEYKYVNHMLDNGQYDNPALNYSFYSWDKQTLHYLKNSVISVRKGILEQIINDVIPEIA